MLSSATVRLNPFQAAAQQLRELEKGARGNRDRGEANEGCELTDSDPTLAILKAIAARDGLRGGPPTMVNLRALMEAFPNPTVTPAPPKPFCREVLEALLVELALRLTEPFLGAQSSGFRAGR